MVSEKSRVIFRECVSLVEDKTYLNMERCRLSSRKTFPLLGLKAKQTRIVWRELSNDVVVRDFRGCVHQRYIIVTSKNCAYEHRQ